MFDNLDANTEDVTYNRFFDLIKK